MDNSTITSGEPLNSSEPASARLDDFLPGRPAEHPTVTLHYGPDNAKSIDVVILGPASPDHVRFTPSLDGASRLGLISAQTLATAIHDPQQQNTLLRKALDIVTTEHGTLTSRIQGLYSAKDSVLSQIRQYAIERHEGGDICREGLNKFLSHFDMDEYRPRIKVTFTISGSYEVDADSIRTAEWDARNHLGVNFDDIDDFIDNSGDYSITVEDTQEITE